MGGAGMPGRRRSRWWLPLAMACLVALTGCVGSRSTPESSASPRPSTVTLRQWAAAAEDRLVDVEVARDTVRGELEHPMFETRGVESTWLGDKAVALVEAVDKSAPIVADCPAPRLARALGNALTLTRKAANLTRVAAASMDDGELKAAGDALSAAARDFDEVKRQIPLGP